MKTNSRAAWMAAALAAIVLAAGCGGDDKPSKPDGGMVDVADGTWREITTVEWDTENPACADLQELFPPTDTTFVLCALSGEDFSDPESGCEVTTEGNTITVDCTTATTVGPCIFTLTIAGSAVVQEKSYTANFTITYRVLGDPGCGALTCSGTAHVTGTWLSGEGDCPTENPRRRRF